ncbi:hypothetical protein OPQ81_008585 [Rhizoctonia solani]|nr:hypothetical protein OPQ81_008585 [Rhizoctonia solani]
MPSTGHTPNDSPLSTDTLRGPQLELLQACLPGMLELCGDTQLQQLLIEYKQAGKEMHHYMPFVQFANHALKLLSPLSPEGLRATLGLEVLFQVNNPQWVKGLNGSISSPDIVLIFLPSARQVHRDPAGNWNDIVDTYSASSPKRLEWPDILAPLELKCNHHPMCSETPTKYSTGLNSLIKPISVPRDQVALVGLHSNDTTTTSALASISSNSAHSIAYAASSEASSSVSRQPKRTSGHLDLDASEPASKRPKSELRNHDIKQTREDAIVQSRINGAEMLHCSLGRRHALAMLIIDTTIWVWWYDRQGAIQSSGFDFVKDLPHFLILLLALQRFHIGNWGFDNELDPSISRRHAPRDLACSGVTDNIPESSTNNTQSHRRGRGAQQGLANSSHWASSSSGRGCSASRGQQGLTSDNEQGSTNSSTSDASSRP